MTTRDTVEIRTTLSLAEAKSVFSSSLQAISRKVEFGAVASSDNPFEESEDFSAFASLKTFAGGWIVQIYITDQGNTRTIKLVPVGSSALGRAVSGLKNSVSKSAGREKVEVVVEALRNADPGLTRQ